MTKHFEGEIIHCFTYSQASSCARKLVDKGWAITMLKNIDGMYTIRVEQKVGDEGAN